jgi:hypothetical protein
VSLRITQSSDQVTRTTAPSVSGGITLLCWTMVRVDRNDFSTFARISVGGSTIVTWSTDGDGTSGPNYFTAGGTVTNATGTPVDIWRKIAISCSGTTAHSYVQDPGSATEHDSGTVSSSGTPDLLALGGRGDVGAGEFLNGRLAYFRIFASELTQGQIETEWNSATAVLTAWADWPLTSDLNDVSGNARHLTAGSTSGGFEADPPLTVTGDLAGSIPLQTVELAGDVILSGDLAGSIPLQSVAIAGDTILSGDLAGSIPLQTASLAGDVVLSGALAGSIPLQAVSLDATEPPSLALPLRVGTVTLAPAHRAGTAALAPGVRVGLVS